VSRRERLLGWLSTPRGAALAGWAVCFVVYLFTQGLPLDRWTQTAWILGALFAANVGRPWRSQLRILLDWLPFVGFLYLYDLTRGVADKLGMPTHVTQPLAAEKWLFHGAVPTSWLQDHFYNPPTYHWWDIAVSLTYLSHFFVVWIYAAVLYVRSRDEWAPWARRILMLSYAGLLTYILYPAAPPWFAADRGLIPGVGRIATRGWDPLGLHFAGVLISQGQAQNNAVAAVPSLHAAFTAMLTVFVWKKLGRVGRVLMVIYTLAMAASLVYGGEHYVFDVLVGYLYVAIVLVLASWWERRRAARRARPPDTVDLSGADVEVDAAGAGARQVT
jgi:membrane-associated phospholipid phosphatase